MGRRRPQVTVILTAVLVSLGLGLTWLLLQPASTSAPRIATVGAQAPQIGLPIVGGGNANLEAERGNVVLVNFWATWCEPCRSEMPAFQRLADDLRDRPFTIYAVDLQEDEPTIQAFVREIGWRLPTMIDDDGTVTRLYGVRALPATFLIDRNGVLRQQRLGPLVDGGPETAWSEAWVAEQVRSLL
jgi:thiol-disulfide isomerase/thioredoxin